jgi:hypothetical protein
LVQAGGLPQLQSFAFDFIAIKWWFESWCRVITYSPHIHPCSQSVHVANSGMPCLLAKALGSTSQVSLSLCIKSSLATLYLMYLTLDMHASGRTRHACSLVKVSFISIHVCRGMEVGTAQLAGRLMPPEAYKAVKRDEGWRLVTVTQTQSAMSSTHMCCTSMIKHSGLQWPYDWLDNKL